MGAICSQAAKVIAEAQQSPAQRKAQETYSQVVAAMEANEAGITPQRIHLKPVADQVRQPVRALWAQRSRTGGSRR